MAGSMCVRRLYRGPASGNPAERSEVSGLMPRLTSVTSAPPAPALPGRSSSPARRIAWASMVGTSLESFDFYVYAYFAAFFVGPLFFEPLGDVGEIFASFSPIAL